MAYTLPCYHTRRLLHRIGQENGCTSLECATGIDANRHVSKVLMRAAILLLVIAGMGYRSKAWLMEVLFQVSTSKSSLLRGKVKWLLI